MRLCSTLEGDFVECDYEASSGVDDFVACDFVASAGVDDFVARWGTL